MAPASHSLPTPPILKPLVAPAGAVPEPQGTPPRFTRNLENIVATDGREVTMSCVVAGSPAPEVTWYHNHECIDRSEDFVITYDRTTGKVDLVIVDCLPDDHGRFRSGWLAGI